VTSKQTQAKKWHADIGQFPYKTQCGLLNQQYQHAQPLCPAKEEEEEKVWSHSRHKQLYQELEL